MCVLSVCSYIDVLSLCALGQSFYATSPGACVPATNIHKTFIPVLMVKFHKFCVKLSNINVKIVKPSCVFLEAEACLHS